MYRQGDLLIRKIDKLPSTVKKRKDDVLVIGEATGHAHRIENGLIYEIPRNKIPRMMERNNEPTMFIKAEKGATVVHEEHDPIELEPGIYQVTRQREWNDGQTLTVWD